MKISFIRGSYVSGIEPTVAEHVISTKQAAVTDNESQYVQLIYATQNFYGTERQRFDSIMLLFGTLKLQDTTFKKTWLPKSVGFITMMQRKMIKLNSMHC